VVFLVVVASSAFSRIQILNDCPSLQARAMQDPEIQNILTDPIMQQVTTSNVCILVEC
jgi:hypothetical protein